VHLHLNFRCAAAAAVAVIAGTQGNNSGGLQGGGVLALGLAMAIALACIAVIGFRLSRLQQGSCCVWLCGRVQRRRG
jgi:hypothetical protein